MGLYGKTVADLVDDGMKIFNDGTVKGNFKYVTGYTEFNESVVEEQEGNFFPFTLKKTGTTMTFKKNGAEVKKDIPFEANNVFRVSQNDTFTVLVDSQEVVTFNFKQATFATKGKARRNRAK
ncbi:hypothetical protein A9CBEGH2_07900 [Amedibacterium intestinale]|nr:hypothetical protein A9CBEGH2_07900 [Amedibacterium intestinale]